MYCSRTFPIFWIFEKENPPFTKSANQFLEMYVTTPQTRIVRHYVQENFNEYRNIYKIFLCTTGSRNKMSINTSVNLLMRIITLSQFFPCKGKIYYTTFLYFNYQLRSSFCTRTNYDCHQRRVPYPTQLLIAYRTGTASSSVIGREGSFLRKTPQRHI